MSAVKTLTRALQQQAGSEKTVTYIEGKDNETTVTFAQLYQRALAVLSALQSKGLKPGDELIIFLRNNELFLDVFWGAVLGGIVPVPVAVGISDEHRSKLFKIFNKLKKPNLFTDNENLERLEKYADSGQLENEFDHLKNKTVLASDISLKASPGEIHLAKEDDICFIQFSSGSTSDPKGVVLTHKNLILNVLAKAAAGGYTEDEVSLSWMPLTHDMGLIGFHINMLVCSMNHCIMSTDLFSRRPVLWMQKVSEHRANVICSPNFGYKHYLKALGDKDPGEIDLSCVRVILNGAEPISTKLCDEFLARMAGYGLKHTSMLPVYGLAEATLAVSFPKWGQDYRAVHVDRHQLKIGDRVKTVAADSDDAVSFPVVGFAVPDMAIQIGNMNGDVYDQGVIGSVMIKGPTVTQGYYDNEQATSEVLTEDGWLDTGDLGFMMQGELVITGRSKEIIFANGQNYYPHDLESILIHSIDIELGKVAAWGIWDEAKQRDQLLLFIIFRGDLNDFVSLAKKAAATLNEQTGLEVDLVIPVKRIPKTTSGKFQRRILGDEYLNGDYDAALQQLAELMQASVATTGNASENASDLQAELVGLCNTVLENTELGPEDNFFETGLSSLTLAEIHQKIDERYPGKVDIVDLFEYQTIEALSEFIEQKKTT